MALDISPRLHPVTETSLASGVLADHTAAGRLPLDDIRSRLINNAHDCLSNSSLYNYLPQHVT